jgi:hypothetical protein
MLAVKDYQAKLANSKGNKPCQLISSQSHLPIKRRQKYVTEQGRNHTALRSPTLVGKEPPFAVASRLEHCLDEGVSERYSIGWNLSLSRRSVKDALRKVWKEIQSGSGWIVDADLRDFFGSADHEKLTNWFEQLFVGINSRG